MKVVMALSAMCILLISPVWGQSAAEVTIVPLTETDIQLLRSDLHGDKKQIIADTMQFTETESVAFWPVYRDYARDQQVIGDDLVKLIKDFVKNYNNLDDANAKDMV